MSRKVVLIAAFVAPQVFTVVTAAHAGIAPVAEPTTFTLLGLGAGAMAVGVWWRNRHRK